MRHPTPMMMTLMLTACLVPGCPAKEADEPGAIVDKKREDAKDEAKDKAKAETKEAAQAVADYAYAQKAEFVAGMKEELATMRKELDELSAKVESSAADAKDDAKLEAKRKLDAARERWTNTQAKLDAAEAAAEADWEGVQRDFKQAREELSGSLDDARQWLSDKIEP